VTPNVFPHLFSLSHPYCEVLPVVCKNKDAENSSHYLWECAELMVLETFADCQCLLAYSSSHGLHSLYAVRKATKAEWKCAASNAENIVSCNTTMTPIGRSSRLSTPQTATLRERHRFIKDESFPG
ncbi:unnamed protein product, partial [Gongylonema pulchrum]|uniref:BK_channel_a domain-containing protein n=1 Tax=Gongylonema pulchrum TaxID=637853 RepID=A0A183EX57_9BILA